MEDDKKVTPEVTPDVTPEVTPDVEETLEEVKARLVKTEELANNYKIRAEKAEKKGDKKPEATVEKKVGDLSTKDIYVLMDAKVPQEDVDEVVDYARFKGISVAEALKTSTIKATLAERGEQRITANATNTGASRRGTSQQSGESLMEQARRGNLPEKDEDIRKVLEAKMKTVKK